MIQRKKTMSALAFSATVLGLAIGATGAVAQDASRYSLEKMDNGYIRFDRQTGAMSVCTGSATELTCKMAAVDRAAYEHDLGQLQERVKKLEDRLAALEKKDATAGLPSEADFEKSMSYMERFLRRFMAIAKSFESEPEKPSTDTMPGRT